MESSKTQMLLRSDKKARLQHRNDLCEEFKKNLSNFQEELDQENDFSPRLTYLYKIMEQSFFAIQKIGEEVKGLLTESEDAFETHCHDKLLAQYQRANAEYRLAMPAQEHLKNREKSTSATSLDRPDRTYQEIPTPLLDLNTSTTRRTEQRTDIHDTLQLIVKKISNFEIDVKQMKREHNIEINALKRQVRPPIESITQDYASSLPNNPWDSAPPPQTSLRKTPWTQPYQNLANIPSRNPSPGLWETSQCPETLRNHTKDRSGVRNQEYFPPAPPGAHWAYKLPRLEVGNFEGKSVKEYYAWLPTFQDVYQSRSDLDSATKLTYLKRHLRGFALQLASSHGTFEEAMKNLHEIYGTPRQLIQELTTELEKLTDQKVNLLELLVLVNSYITLFKAIDREPTELIPMLLHPITKKLPDAVRLQWSKKVRKMEKREKKVRVTDFSEFLIETINLYKEADLPVQATIYGSKKTEGLSAQKERSKSPIPKSTMMFNAIVTERKQCQFCNENSHSDLWKCHQLTSLPVAMRRQEAQERHLCYKCLGRHRNEDCSAPLCALCEKAHHTLLHMDYQNSSNFPHPRTQTIDAQPRYVNNRNEYQNKPNKSRRLQPIMAPHKRPQDRSQQYCHHPHNHHKQPNQDVTSSLNKICLEKLDSILEKMSQLEEQISKLQQFQARQEGIQVIKSQKCQSPASKVVLNAVCAIEPKTCPFCQEQSHANINQCAKVRLFPLAARWHLARASRLCFKCLIRHNFKRCKAPPCKICNKLHHESLHYEGNQTIKHNQRKKKNDTTSNNPSHEGKSEERAPEETIQISMQGVAKIAKGSEMGENVSECDHPINEKKKPQGEMQLTKAGKNFVGTNHSSPNLMKHQVDPQWMEKLVTIQKPKSSQPNFIKQLQVCSNEKSEENAVEIKELVAILKKKGIRLQELVEDL